MEISLRYGQKLSSFEKLILPGKRCK